MIMFRFWLHTPDPESEPPGLIGMSKVPEIFGPFKFARVITAVVTGISSIDIGFESRCLILGAKVEELMCGLVICNSLYGICSLLY